MNKQYTFGIGDRFKYVGPSLSAFHKVGTVVANLGTNSRGYERIQVKWDEGFDGYSIAYAHNLMLVSRGVPKGAALGVPAKRTSVPAPSSDKAEQALGKYILWNPTSHRPPTVTLPTKKEAERVAALMAEQHGGVFYICKIAGGKQKKVITTTESF